MEETTEVSTLSLPTLRIKRNSRTSQSASSLTSESGKLSNKIAKKLRHWSTGQSLATSKVDLSPDPNAESDLQDQRYDTLGPSLGPLTTTQSCIDVSTINTHTRNGAFSKSTPQLNTDPVMRTKVPKNVRNEKLESRKKVSISTPNMFSSESIDNEDIPPHANVRRNEKFHKVFRNVSVDEKVLNFFSCALVGDILLQGRLYITDNYFGFYSNILGHITKILIPVKKVTDIKKVRTAKVIPNAIKITADTKKFTFTSLMSRDTTIRLMVKVWRKSEPEAQGTIDNYSLNSRPSSEASSSCSNVAEDFVDGPAQLLTSATLSTSCEEIKAEGSMTSLGPVNSGDEQSKPLHTYKTYFDVIGMAFPVPKLLHRLRAAVIGLSSLPRTTLFLVVCTVILIFLYMSAAFLIYRLNVLHRRYGFYGANDGGQSFQDIYRWQNQLHAESVDNLQDALAIQIKQLTEVRKSLELLKTVASNSQDTFQDTDVRSAT